MRSAVGGGRILYCSPQLDFLNLFYYIISCLLVNSGTLCLNLIVSIYGYVFIIRFRNVLKPRTRLNTNSGLELCWFEGEGDAGWRQEGVGIGRGEAG